MINFETFNSINTEIENSIKEVFEHCRLNNFDNYILLLANGEYNKIVNDYVPSLNPYCIDSKIDLYRDNSRDKFITDFLNNHYCFLKENDVVEDNEYRFFLELMIYCHIWESKLFLKTLYRLANIYSENEYKWIVNVPDKSKHTFIREEIRDLFLKSNKKMGNIITKGFHSSLRNAFAHSEYSIDTKSKKIYLHNFSRQDWELENIAFDDWSMRFIYSCLLSYHLIKRIRKERIDFCEFIQNETFEIKRPCKGGSFKFANVTYLKDKDKFIFNDTILKR